MTQQPTTPRSTLGKPAAALAALALTGAAGCPSTPPPRYPIQQSSRILDVLRAREAQLQQGLFHAEGSIDQFGRQGRVRGNVAIFVQRPNRVRVGVSALGIQDALTVVSNGTEFRMLNLNTHQFLIGPALPCVAQQTLGLPLSAPEATAVLSGGAPLLGTDLSAPRWEGGRYVVEVNGQGGVHERIELELPPEQRDAPAEQQTPRVRRVEVRDERGVRYEVDYQNYRTVGGIAFPDRVRVRVPRQDVDTQVRFDRIDPAFRVEPDPEVPDATAADPFALEQSQGTERVPIECEG